MNLDMLGRDARLGSNQILVHNGCGRQGRSNGVCIKHGAMVKRGKPKSLRSSGLRIWILHYIMSDLDVSGFLELLLSPHACHRLRLHFLAPCFLQTPPCWTRLLHPSWLQYLRFTLAPCLTQTPPCLTLLSHPSWRQYLRFTTSTHGLSWTFRRPRAPPEDAVRKCLLHGSEQRVVRQARAFMSPIAQDCGL